MKLLIFKAVAAIYKSLNSWNFKKRRHSESTRNYPPDWFFHHSCATDALQRHRGAAIKKCSFIRFIYNA
jgi:hypothetical protein